MKTINIEIENCYGISKLEYKFDYPQNQNTYVIYAPNGVMKTSFAKVFDDYSKELPSGDLINTSLTSIRKFTDENELEINKDSVFVIKPYDDTFESNKTSTLLVKKELKDKYENIYNVINNKKKSLISDLSKKSEYKSEIEIEIISTFSEYGNDFFKVLKKLKSVITNNVDENLLKIKYNEIFNNDVVEFLKSSETRENLSEYANKYNELLNKTKYLKKGFDHYNAETVQKNLKSNNYFDAKHTINLVSGEEKVEISSLKELEDVLKKERESVFDNEEIKSIFNKIDRSISNAKLRNFRAYLFENKEITKELLDLGSFKRRLWINYLNVFYDKYIDLVSTYESGEIEITKIVDAANREVTEWEKVLSIFNSRFYVPFMLKVVNKEDSILKDIVPAVGYYHKDTNNEINKELLKSTLSQGELRALYLINIIFEIESRKNLGIETLYIIDDIADSFDYKNKYAIVQYIKEVDQSDLFKTIILTHNFDFYRTIQERIENVKYGDKSLIASRTLDGIIFEKVNNSYVSNPFKIWKQDLATSDIKLIASISFARNICEHIGRDDFSNKLTSLLHIKPDTASISIEELETIYKEVFKDLQTLDLPGKERKVYEVIKERGIELSTTLEEGLNLENKIAISIVIRLTAEEYMIRMINEPSYVAGINSSQTGKLYRKFKAKFGKDHESIKVLDNVNLMTPENIHLNSFMFEPILDLSSNHLKQLYLEVQNL
ncbi:MAG: hypothetical protein BGO41_09325 [Clostridiales bacterium 38-18]|nr:MAG: hypothetical protein BGO41_09325 [Clostridiales bacterium 38-18]